MPMTDREFWQQMYRHLKGLADLAREKLEESRDIPSWPKTIAGVDVRDIDSEKMERIIDIVRKS